MKEVMMLFSLKLKEVILISGEIVRQCQKNKEVIF